MRYGLVHYEPSHSRMFARKTECHRIKMAFLAGMFISARLRMVRMESWSNVFLFPPNMTTGGQLFEVTVEKNDGKWMVTNYSNDETYTATTFQQLMQIPQAKSLKWTEVTIN